MKFAVINFLALPLYFLATTYSSSDERAAEECFSASNPETIIEICSEIIEVDKFPKDFLSRAFYQRGTAFLRQQQARLALRDFDRAIELDSDFPQAFANRGGAFIELGSYEEAVESYLAAIDLEPSADRFVLLGFSQLKLDAGLTVQVRHRVELRKPRWACDIQDTFAALS